MKVQRNLFNVVALGVVLCMTAICFAVPPGTAFTYQGLLDGIVSDTPLYGIQEE